MDGEVLADLVRHGDQWIAARGGQGGRGNTRFLSNARRAPSFAEQGEYGEERWLKLELKLLADVALVGFPNAGKSTLISVISAAKPKIANYPFTTLEPHLGVVRWQEHEFVVADIPGLIEGAAEGKGLGHEFLRHIERARVLVILCDLAAVDGRDPHEQEAILLDELRRYRPELLERPRIVVGSKADVAELPFDGLRIAAVTRGGIDELLGRDREARGVRAGQRGRTRGLRDHPARGTRVLRGARRRERVARQRQAGRARGRARRPDESRGDGVRAATAGAHGRRARPRTSGRGRRRRRTHRRRSSSRTRSRCCEGAAVTLVVVKVGTSSITRASGDLDEEALVKLASDLAAARARPATGSCS